MRWIIGDIHGMLRPLSGLLREITRRDPWAHLLFVGDFVNRGPDSRGVIELLLTLRNAHFVRGNHDDIFDLVLHGSAYAPNPQAPEPVSAFVWFMEHGLANTFESYGVDYALLEQAHRQPSPERIKKIADAVPAAHRQFIHRLPVVIEHDDIFITHGMWDADTPDKSPGIAERLAADPALRGHLLWGRFGDEITRKKAWNRTGYFGHTPVQTYPKALTKGEVAPVRADKMVLLDTGSAVSPDGLLTAVCAESGDAIQADRRGEIV